MEMGKRGQFEPNLRKIKPENTGSADPAIVERVFVFAKPA
jgi:hypothetical protein